jgi:hypothetical protein
MRFLHRPVVLAQNVDRGRASGLIQFPRPADGVRQGSACDVPPGENPDEGFREYGHHPDDQTIEPGHGRSFLDPFGQVSRVSGKVNSSWNKNKLFLFWFIMGRSGNA